MNQEEHNQSILELVNEYQKSSLSVFQQQGPLLNGRVINANFNNIDDLQINLGDTVKYDIFDCKNFPVQMRELVNEYYEGVPFQFMTVKEHMEYFGNNNTINFSRKVQKLIISNLLSKLHGCPTYDKDVIINKKSSIIAHRDFIEEHMEFFNKFRKEKSDNEEYQPTWLTPEKANTSLIYNRFSQIQSETIYKWHILHSKYLDVYQCDYFPPETAILFDDDCLLVPINYRVDQYPFPSAFNADPISKINFRLSFANLPLENKFFYNYTTCFGVGFLPTHLSLLKL